MNFEVYKLHFETQLDQYIEQLEGKSVLKEACRYALMSGGKRLRPILVLMVADAIGSCDVTPVARSVEFFHTASLIADDLPCMDNDEMRRGRPSLHKVFGESTALLASYTLIAAGYGGIYENAKKMRQNPEFSFSSEKRAIECLEVVSRCAGIQGATQGQFLDLFPPDPSLETIRDIIYKKTVTLFEISFIFGWLFGGGDFSEVPHLKRCAYHLGMAFQIADDLEDCVQDSCLARGINIVSVLGKERAVLVFKEELDCLEASLKKVSLWTKPFQEVFALLAGKGSLFLGGFFDRPARC